MIYKRQNCGAFYVGVLPGWVWTSCSFVSITVFVAATVEAVALKTAI
jgi:hypothetical protein